MPWLPPILRDLAVEFWCAQGRCKFGQGLRQQTAVERQHWNYPGVGSISTLEVQVRNERRLICLALLTTTRRIVGLKVHLVEVTDRIRRKKSVSFYSVKKIHKGYLFPLGYDTTISWSSSIPTTVPVVPRHSNIPSVQPPWPCCNVWTNSKSRSTLTCTIQARRQPWFTYLLNGCLSNLISYGKSMQTRTTRTLFTK